MADITTAPNATEVQSELGFGQGVSGGPGINQIYTRDEDSAWSEVKTFTQTFVHAIGPGSDYAGTRIETNAQNKLCFSYDWGASMIPYNHYKCATTPEHLQPYLQKANSVRMLGHSVTCFDLIVLRDEIQADGRIVSTPQIDDIEIFEDNNGKFRPQNIVPATGRSFFELNNGYRTVEPRNLEECTIPRIKIQFPPEMYIAAERNALDDLHLRGFNPYNGLFTVRHWRTS